MMWPTTPVLAAYLIGMQAAAVLKAEGKLK